MWWYSGLSLPWGFCMGCRVPVRYICLLCLRTMKENFCIINQSFFPGVPPDFRSCAWIFSTVGSAIFPCGRQRYQRYILRKLQPVEIPFLYSIERLVLPVFIFSCRAAASCVYVWPIAFCLYAGLPFYFSNRRGGLVLLKVKVKAAAKSA